MKRLLALFGSVLLLAVAAPAPAQMVEGVPAGPTIQAARAGVTAPPAAVPVANEARQAGTPSRQSAALMIVGGAALLAGLVIGGGAGTAIAVGGALVGLYGLWMYVR